MRHRKRTGKFGRQSSHYKATLRHLVSGLIISKSICTTKAKAKESSRLAEKLVTIGKDNTVAGRRKAYSILRSRDLVSMLFNDIAPLFKERNGGYTRVMLTERRHGDNAEMAILEFIEKPKKERIQKKEETKKEKVVQPLPKTKIEKKEEPAKAKPQKEEIIRNKEPKKIIQQPETLKKSKEAKPKPGFFKRIFGRKKDT